MCFCTPSIRTPFCGNCNSYMFNRIRYQAEEIKAEQHKVKVLTDAIDNLVQQKGRHNTEIAYKRLVEAIANVKGLDK